MVKTAMVVGTSAGNLNQAQNWFGRSLDAISIAGGHDGWSDWKTSLDSLSGVFGHTGKDVLWSVPLIPSGANLASAADGDYDSHYRELAKTFVENAGNDSQIYIRLGWEFNGDDYFPWSAVGKSQDYVGAFQNFVDAFRSVSDKFRFEWCPNKGDVGMNPADAYPGDAYVDVIGMDFYWDSKQSWSFTDPVQAWNYFVNEKYGLQWHQDFADAHDKPTAYSEWGVNSNNAKAFMDLADKWFNSHDVLYQNYWNSDSNFQGKLSDGQYPNTGAAFKSEFATEAATGAVVVPGHVAIGGTSGNNHPISVGAGSDRLQGGNAADTLDGGGGVDTMLGGDGNDTYVVANTAAVITEYYHSGTGGTDMVRASANYTLPSFVEKLTMTGTDYLDAIGNELGNVITGNSVGNAISGREGDDTLNGGDGADQLFGGAGNDVFIAKAGEANGDMIGDFEGNGNYSGDSIVLQGYGAGAYATIGSHALTIHYSAGLETINLGSSGIDWSDFSFG